jgi:purine-binding chemotaxis protein CheW
MSNTISEGPANTGLISGERQFVTFLIGGETYGVSAGKVQEIIGMTEITFVPQSLPYLKGVINLRGAVVPVIDMRLKFGLEEIEYISTTVIIIVRIGRRLVGMVVDSVSDVLNIPVKSIQDTPHFSSRIETDYIENIGQADDRLIIIINVDRLVTSEEFEGIKKRTKIV